MHKYMFIFYVYVHITCMNIRHIYMPICSLKDSITKSLIAYFEFRLSSSLYNLLELM